MSAHPADLLVRKLRSHSRIDPSAIRKMLALPTKRRLYRPNEYIISEGNVRLDRCSFILSGFAFRQKLTPEGARQIFSIHIPGDLLDIQHLHLYYADHNIQALTEMASIDFDRKALRDLALAEPTVGRALWIDSLIEASTYREWMMNIGRRDGLARTAHLLCELALRLKVVGLGDGESISLPLTQHQIGDALGMTAVHVNRLLKKLKSSGFIDRSSGLIRFLNPRGMIDTAGFNPMYLHLETPNERQD